MTENKENLVDSEGLNAPKSFEETVSSYEGDLRELKISCGMVDPSPQKDWETERVRGLGDRHMGQTIADGDDYDRLKTPCEDFRLLFGYRVISDDFLDELKLGKVDYFPSVTYLTTSKSLQEDIDQEEKNLDCFESPINREIAQKQIIYYRKLLDFLVKREGEYRGCVGDSEYLKQYFSRATIDKPLFFDIHNEGRWASVINSFLVGKTVAISSDGIDGLDGIVDVGENRVGQYIGLDLWEGLISSYRLDNVDLKKINREWRLANNINSKYFIKHEKIDSIVGSIRDAGYNVESIVGGNGVIAITLPKTKVEAHLLKYKLERGFIKGVFYYGTGLVEVNNESETEKLKKIVEELKRKEDKVLEDEFIKKYNVEGNTPILKGKYIPSIPERFLVLLRVNLGSIANGYNGQSCRGHNVGSEVYLIDREAIKGKRLIEVKIPDEAKGTVIGKGGENIRRISNELGISTKIV